MARAQSIQKFTASLGFLAAFALAGCGLKIAPSESPRTHESDTCRSVKREFPSAKTWSSELLTSLLACSAQGRGLDAKLMPSFKTQPLDTTARWLNESFDDASRDDLVEFLDSVPQSFGKTLHIFSLAVPPTVQRYWPEWISWTRAALDTQSGLRPEILTEQLAILASVPSDSIDALITLMEKLRAADDAERAKIFERLTKIYIDFSRDPALKGFLLRGIEPLDCLKLEADRKDTSLISSGWSLLVGTKDDPVTFGRTFAQSYGLLQSFCRAEDIPTHTETHAALDYFVRQHSEVFAPVLDIADGSTRALIPLLRQWSQSTITLSEVEFTRLFSQLNHMLTLAHSAPPGAFSAYLRVLAQWAQQMTPDEITTHVEMFRRVSWEKFRVPRPVIDEWSSGAQQHRISFLDTLATFVASGAHQKMSSLLRVIKIRGAVSTIRPPRPPSPLAVPAVPSIADRLLTYGNSPIAGALPKSARFLECLKSPSSQELWSCLQSRGEKIPFTTALMRQEKASPLFFLLRDPEQPGRWLGQGFFGASALPLWAEGMNKLQGLRLPIEHFVRNFPFGELTSDEQIHKTYAWLRSAPQHQPESEELRKDLGIPFRLVNNDFSSPVWQQWFRDPSKWAPVQRVLTDPHRGAKILTELKNLTRRRVSVQLFRSDEEGLTLTRPAKIGMLSALDILLWETPYDMIREWIIGQILDAKAPGDLAIVLTNAKSKLQTALWALERTPFARHGKLWKKATNALTILDATIAMRVENELFAWSEIMKALAAGLPRSEAEVFLVNLQKTGIISSISHLLHEYDPTAARFASTLITVFHMIRDARASELAWVSAVLENQKSHGLFVYQILALCHDALASPASHFHLKQMTSLVKTGSYWIDREKRILPFKKAFDTIAGPESVFNPWIWVFLREIQDPRTSGHRPWLRVLASLESSEARDEIRAWIDTGIPANIGSWMDAIILAPSSRF
ncbi:MAG TPA: hypothetical protein VM901_02595 [Bdellovibrionota bacterium]|nr:hypothetical protein [Bdellovibrionota bacterium]